MRITYMHPRVGKGRATVAIRYERGNPKVEAAVAFCAPQDQFTRKRGRVIATGRLDAQKSEAVYKFQATVGENDSLKEVVCQRLKEYLASGGAAPYWAARQEPVSAD